VAGRYIAQHLPERAVILTMLHSGTVRYYSGRPTIRYDFIPPADLESVVAGVRRLGYEPYIVVDWFWEEDRFREQFAGESPLGRLDWEPIVIEPGSVRLYALPPTGVSSVLQLRVPDRSEGVVVKEGIHPKYQDVDARCACGNTFKTRSTKPELHLEICSACHPFFTGRQKLIDTEGRVERFNKKFGLQTSEQRKEAAKAAKAGRTPGAKKKAAATA
jgi:large subunit ribosomal protein L31